MNELLKIGNPKTHLSPWVMQAMGLVLLCVSAAGAQAQQAGGMDGAQATRLTRMVRQDCGSCHGMRLTGGLGPALTPQAMKEIPVESIAATIYHGRPGTPMPPWRGMLNEQQAQWIAEQLQAGFPEEVGERRAR